MRTPTLLQCYCFFFLLRTTLYRFLRVYVTLYRTIGIPDITRMHVKVAGMPNTQACQGYAIFD